LFVGVTQGGARASLTLGYYGVILTGFRFGSLVSAGSPQKPANDLKRGRALAGGSKAKAAGSCAIGCCYLIGQEDWSTTSRVNEKSDEEQRWKYNDKEHASDEPLQQQEAKCQ
jgi:hypothetical protein